MIYKSGAKDLYFFFFFFQKKLFPLVFEILQMRLLCTNPCRDAIVPSYVDAH